MSKCFWSYNYRLITTLQQHENLQLIVASPVDQVCQHVVTHSSPVCPYQQTTVAKYPFHRSRGNRQTEYFSNGWNSLNASLSQVPRPRPRPKLEGSKTKTKTLGFQDQDRDRDSRDPRPRPILWGSKTKTETKTCKNGSRDVSRPRLKSRELKVWSLLCTNWCHIALLMLSWTAKIILYTIFNKMLSYRRETALQGALQFSPKVEDWNWETIIFYGHYKSIFNHNRPKNLSNFVKKTENKGY